MIVCYFKALKWFESDGKSIKMLKPIMPICTATFPQDLWEHDFQQGFCPLKIAHAYTQCADYVLD